MYCAYKFTVQKWKSIKSPFFQLWPTQTVPKLVCALNFTASLKYPLWLQNGFPDTMTDLLQFFFKN